MELLFGITLFLGLAFIGHNYIKNHSLRLYIIGVLVATLGFIGNVEFILDGFLGTALLVLVMFAGVLNKRWHISKVLRKIRAEYSILGVMLVTPHVLYYTFESLLGVSEVEIFGLISYLVMIPLFITSFTIIRKKMSYKSWKKLQSFAYLAYSLIYLHLLVIGNNVLIYTVLFTLYFVLSILKTKRSRLLNQVMVSSVILMGMLTVQGGKLIQTDALELETVEVINETSSSSVSSSVIDITSDTVYVDGTFEATVSAFKGKQLSVEVVVSGGIIQEVNVISTGTTGGRYAQAVYSVADNVVNTNSVDVDTVHGSTISTSALLRAIDSVLVEA